MGCSLVQIDSVSVHLLGVKGYILIHIACDFNNITIFDESLVEDLLFFLCGFDFLNGGFSLLWGNHSDHIHEIVVVFERGICRIY